MKKSFFVMLMIGLGGVAMAQTNRPPARKTLPGVKNLTIGDKVPDIFIPKLINYKSHTAKLSDFKSDLVIIDFWSINCSGCVAGLPKMKALQDQFGDSIKIIPVTFDPEKVTIDFWKQNHHTKGLDLLSVVDDKIFEATFRHLGIPHEIWIYKSVVTAITFADYVTGANIRQILAGKKVGWEVKNDFMTKMDPKKPLLLVDNKQYDNPTGPVKYAAMFGYREMDMGGGMGTVKDSVRHTIRSYFINNSVLGAYFNYWHKLRDPDYKNKAIPFFVDPGRTILEVKNPMEYASLEQTGDYLNVWHQKHLFCYEAVHLDTGQSKDDITRADIANLDFLLGMHGRFETRRVKCLVLIKTGTGENLKTAGGYGGQKQDGNTIKLTRLMLANLANILNGYIGNPPVFDETGFKGEVDLDLKATSWTDLAGIRASLKNYGLELKEEERELEMFVLTATR